MGSFDWSSFSSLPSPSPHGIQKAAPPFQTEPSWPWEGSFPCLDNLRTLVRAGGARVDLEAPRGRRETRDFCWKDQRPPNLSTLGNSTFTGD